MNNKGKNILLYLCSNCGLRAHLELVDGGASLVIMKSLNPITAEVLCTLIMIELLTFRSQTKKSLRMT